MNLQDILDFVARHLLTQNDKCLSPKGTCQCQQGSLRCAAACLAIESDVTQWIAPTSIPSLCGLDQSYEDFICDFIRIHDDKPVESWPRLLNNLALKHGLQPFGPGDLQFEGGKLTRWPYGIQIPRKGRSFLKLTPQQAQRVCLRTISRHGQLTLAEFARVYCPPNHKVWCRNVMVIYAQETKGKR